MHVKMHLRFDGQPKSKMDRSGLINNTIFLNGIFGLIKFKKKFKFHLYRGGEIDRHTIQINIMTKF